MKNLLAAIGILALVCWDNAQSLKKEIYSFVSFEIIRKDARGILLKSPAWDGPIRMPLKDSFYIYQNVDSFRMFSPDTIGGILYKKIELSGYKWKPKAEFGDLMYKGLYERDANEGLRFAIYASKDWGTLMQIIYTNPGNMSAAILFSKDSVNILQKAGILIDPTKEISEPERLVPVQ